MVVDIAFLSFLGIGDDASCHGSSHLAYEDFVSRSRLYDNRGAFVFGRSLWQPCLFEVSVVMAHHLYESLHGKPVGMDIGDAHEDADHQPSVVEVFVFVYLFDDHYVSVCRCHHHVVGGVAFEDADGASEEIDNDGVDGGKDNEYGPEGDGATCCQEPPAKGHDADEYGQSQYECGYAFMVYSILFYLFQSSHYCVFCGFLSCL